MQGAPHTARLKKNDGTTMACGGHWHTTPAQVKTEKTARHLEPRQPGGCKLKTAPVRPVVAARPAEYVCSEDLFY
ncbi:hypothetical protein ACJHYV_23360 [Escherichia sp. WS3227_1]|uniref:hypothetical protein n=1 Tax=Escherichia sp. WS3227_1 TaxID=3381983 RepID=UPI00396F60B6